jgi:hypothetical protein
VSSLFVFLFCKLSNLDSHWIYRDCQQLHKRAKVAHTAATLPHVSLHAMLLLSQIYLLLTADRRERKPSSWWFCSSSITVETAYGAWELGCSRSWGFWWCCVACECHVVVLYQLLLRDWKFGSVLASLEGRKEILWHLQQQQQQQK